MREQVETRLQSLRAEFETGQKMLTDLEAREANLRVTLTRISGAIQALEEILEQAPELAPLNATPSVPANRADTG